MLWLIFSDSVVNHGSESGVDLGSSSLKDDVNQSPSGSLPSSPFSESLSLLGGSLNGSFVCDHCGLTFAHRDDLEKHEVSHPVPNQVGTHFLIGFLCLLIRPTTWMRPHVPSIRSHPPQNSNSCFPFFRICWRLISSPVKSVLNNSPTSIDYNDTW